MVFRKANGNKLNKDFLKSRISEKYGKQKWIEFCEVMLDEGYDCYLYEARRTFSKYVTIRDRNTKKTFKVRFSNHKPIQYREAQGDCDFFVGVTNFKVTTTDMAIQATRDYMKGDNLCQEELM